MVREPPTCPSNKSICGYDGSIYAGSTGMVVPTVHGWRDTGRDMLLLLKGCRSGCEGTVIWCCKGTAQGEGEHGQYFYSCKRERQIWTRNFVSTKKSLEAQFSWERRFL